MPKYLLTLCFITLFLQGQATETRIIVRAKAKDAKYIGTSIGGALILVKNESTGELLAQGKTEGSTGNTTLIMNTPKTRGMATTDAQTAKFEAVLGLNTPTRVLIEAYAPFNLAQARAVASVSLWAIPGKHILGDGVVLEIPGFVIDVLSPRTHQFVSIKNLTEESLTIRANIVMMCGCTIKNEGLWDAKKMEVVAIVKSKGKLVKEVPMACTADNLFEGKLALQSPGAYEVTVYAYQADTGNTGVGIVNFIANP